MTREQAGTPGALPSTFTVELHWGLCHGRMKLTTPNGTNNTDDKPEGTE